MLLNLSNHLQLELSSCETFALGHTSFGDEEGKYIATQLIANKKLKTLALFDCDFSNNSLSLISQGISSSNLQKLEIRAGTLPGKDISHLFGTIVSLNSQVKILCICDINISPQDAEVLFTNIPRTNISTLHLENCNLIGLSISMLAVRLKDSLITCLNLSGNCHIMDLGLLALTDQNHLSNLIELDLSNCGITDQGLKHFPNFLKQSNRIQSINLSSNDITSNGLQLITNGLIHHKTVEFLHLNSCKITDAGIISFGKDLNKTKLKQISLDSNEMTDESIPYLFQGVYHTLSLETIYLDFNSITDKYLDKISTSIIGHPRLKILSIEETMISDKNIQKLENIIDSQQSKQVLTLSIFLSVKIVSRLGRKSGFKHFPMDMMRHLKSMLFGG